MGFRLIFMSLMFLPAGLPLGFLAASEQSRLLQWKGSGVAGALPGASEAISRIAGRATLLVNPWRIPGVYLAIPYPSPTGYLVVPYTTPIQLLLNP